MEKPWIDGPKELLQHAIEHISGTSDFDRRIAFISIDNSVELSIKTYLALPRRIRNQEGPTRKELQDAENSFPTYLDLLEHYGQDKLLEIKLNDIEWYHRLRNQLYHNGNGLTVDKAILESYFEIAKSLFESLFEHKLIKQDFSYTTSFGKFMEKWTLFERELKEILPPKNNEYAYYWKRNFLDAIDSGLVPIFNEVMNFRNEVVHGTNIPAAEDFDQMISKIDFINDAIKRH
jgi:hypothetical protein